MTLQLKKLCAGCIGQMYPVGTELECFPKGECAMFASNAYMLAVTCRAPQLQEFTVSGLSYIKQTAWAALIFTTGNVLLGALASSKQD